MRLLKYGAVFLLALVLIGGWQGYRLVWGKPASIDHFADRVMLGGLLAFPEVLTFLGVVENTPLDFHSNRWSDLSPDAMASLVEKSNANWGLLQLYSNDTLDKQENLTFSYLEWRIGSTVEANAFPYHMGRVLYTGPYPVNQISGAQAEPILTLTNLQQVVDEDSARRYLERMAAIPEYVDRLIAAISYRDKIGANPPVVIVDRSLEQVNGIVLTDPEELSLHTTLQNKSKELGFDDALQSELEQQSLAILSADVIPAYRRLAAKLEVIRARAPEAVGVGQLPNGDAYYRALLYAHASTRKSPDEIHQMGLRLVAGFREELFDALDSLGYTEGGIVERIEQMMNEQGARYDNSDEARAQIIADYTRIGEELAVATAPVFGMRPEAPVEVIRVPQFQQDGEAGAFYTPPSLDGTRPGRFFINLRAPDEIERHGMKTLSAHESIPGHHFESALGQTLTELPMLRQNAVISSYGEGWALYGEHLVHELGLHDVRSNIGRLQSMLFRASRLVVDTGIHAKGWTREQAIDYLRENTGQPERDVTAEIERYIAMPAQACSYMLGMQSILAAREAARERMGDRFNLPDFHDAVLANGALPIEVLEQELEAVLQ